MSYFRYFASRTVKESLKRPYVYLLSILFSLLAVLILKKIGEACLTAKTLEFMSMAIIFNGLLPACFVSIYLCAVPVFYIEKKQRSLTMLLCSPAGLGELFWGKTTGLVISAFMVPTLAVLASLAVFTPHVLAVIATWKMLAALGIVTAMAAAYATVAGVALLTARDDQIINVVVFGLALAQVWLAKLTRSAAGAGLPGGVLYQYVGIMCGYMVIAGAAYFLFFSRVRVVESV